MSSELIVHTSDADFERDVLQSDVPVLLDFWAPWCGPCKKLAPIVEEIAKEYEGKAFVGKVDVDDCPEFTDLVGIRNVPTVVFYKNGELQADRVIGASDKSALTARLNALL